MLDFYILFEIELFLVILVLAESYMSHFSFSFCNGYDCPQIAASFKSYALYYTIDRREQNCCYNIYYTVTGHVYLLQTLADKIPVIIQDESTTRFIVSGSKGLQI